VEYQVRAAKITDVERIVALWSEAAPSATSTAREAADLLRQLVYLPQASVLVAEAARTIVGAAVLALRLSVRTGGYVGTIDLIVVDPRHDAELLTGLLAEEVLRSARNKGCAVVELATPAESSSLAAWERLGFTAAGARIETLLPVRRVRTGRG
jgi:hypothetical protein